MRAYMRPTTASDTREGRVNRRPVQLPTIRDRLQKQKRAKVTPQPEPKSAPPRQPAKTNLARQLSKASGGASNKETSDKLTALIEQINVVKEKQVQVQREIETWTNPAFDTLPSEKERAKRLVKKAEKSPPIIGSISRMGESSTAEIDENLPSNDQVEAIPIDELLGETDGRDQVEERYSSSCEDLVTSDAESGEYRANVSQEGIAESVGEVELQNLEGMNCREQDSGGEERAEVEVVDKSGQSEEEEEVREEKYGHEEPLGTVEGSEDQPREGVVDSARVYSVDEHHEITQSDEESAGEERSALAEVGREYSGTSGEAEVSAAETPMDESESAEEIVEAQVEDVDPNDTDLDHTTQTLPSDPRLEETDISKPFFYTKTCCGSQVDFAWDPRKAMPENVTYSLYLQREGDTKLIEVAKGLKTNAFSAMKLFSRKTDTQNARFILRTDVICDVRILPQPQGVKASSASQTEITLAWHRDPKLSYSIAVSRAEDPDHHSAEFETRDGRYILKGLNPGTSYLLRLRATDGSEFMSDSSDVAISTIPLAASDLRVESTSSSNVSFMWLPSTGCTQHKMHIIETFSGEVVYDEEIGREGKNTVETLETGVEYSCILRSGNSSGYESDGVSVPFKLLPKIDKLNFTVTSATSQLAEWESVGDAVHYKVEIKEGRSGDFTVLSESEELPCFSFKGLTINEVYVTRVYPGFEGGFASEYCESSFRHTFPAPESLQVLSLNSDSVELGWEALPGDNEYLVSKRYTENRTTESVYEGVENQIMISGLKSGVSYTFEVYGRDKNSGFESDSASIDLMPLECCMDLRVFNVNPTTAELTWSPVADASLYEVSLKRVSPRGEESEYEVVDARIESAEYKLKNLDPGQTYVVRVCAGNACAVFETVGASQRFITASVDPRTKAKLISLMIVSVEEARINVRWKAVPDCTSYLVMTACMGSLEENGNKEWTEQPRQNNWMTTESVLIPGFSDQPHQYAVRVDAIKPDKHGEETVFASDEVYVLPPIASDKERHDAFLEQIRRLKLRYQLANPLAIDTITRGSHYQIDGITCHITSDRTIIVRVGGGYEYFSVWFRKHVVPQVSKSSGFDSAIAKREKMQRTNSAGNLQSPRRRGSIGRVNALNTLRTSDWDLIKERRMSTSRVMV